MQLNNIFFSIPYENKYSVKNENVTLSCFKKLSISFIQNGQNEFVYVTNLWNIIKISKYKLIK